MLADEAEDYNIRGSQQIERSTVGNEPRVRWRARDFPPKSGKVSSGQRKANNAERNICVLALSFGYRFQPRKLEPVGFDIYRDAGGWDNAVKLDRVPAFHPK